MKPQELALLGLRKHIPRKGLANMSTPECIHEGERKEGERIYLTTEEVCEIYGIGRTTLRKWRAEGCPAFKIDGGYRYLADLVEM